MTDIQWENLLSIVNGEAVGKLPSGFIIDSPWLPGWYGMSVIDYYSSEQAWFLANQKAIETFPEVMFLPGFWAEYGMCTEPSAFGSKLIWSTDQLPHAQKIMEDAGNLADLQKPSVSTDGLLPFILNRLVRAEPDIHAMGHKIRFAVSRGPLNIASFLAGSTELMLEMAMRPEGVLKGLESISDFVVDWLTLQAETLQEVQGILILDDIVGFLGEEDFTRFAKPFLKRIFGALDLPVRLFHNDAAGKICAPFLEEMGVNIFNFSFEHTLQEMREWAGDKVVLLGNIPPRDVLAKGSPQNVREAVRKIMSEAGDMDGIIWSCGGGMPPHVTTENIHAFLSALNDH
jgi:uroporphyrinogen decarboxylase